MPPDLPNEQELMLKKRARRRLVGAIALVLLMVIVLPQVLQDRAVLTQQEAIKITMPDAVSENSNPTVDTKPNVDNHMAESETNQQSADTTDDKSSQTEVDVRSKSPAETPVPRKETESKKSEIAPAKVEAEKKVAVKAPEPSDPEPSVTAKPEIAVKSNETFTVQVGVYSDLANVKRIQDQLKQAGFSAYTEKIKTPKGESIRLKTGKFSSRQDAVTALGKLKEMGLSGIVVSNE